MYTTIGAGQLEKCKRIADQHYIDLGEGHKTIYLIIKVEDVSHKEKAICETEGYKSLSFYDIMTNAQMKNKTQNDMFDEFWFN